MSTPIICIIVAATCFILYYLISKIEKKQKEKAAEATQQQAEAQFTLEQNNFLNVVDRLYKDNEVKSVREIYEECGMPHDIAFGTDTNLIEENIPFVKGERPHDVFTTYTMTIGKRYELANQRLIPISSDHFGLNLHKKENIYHALYGVTLYQEKTTLTNVLYSGCVWKNGPLRTGNLSVIANEITRFSPIDTGKIYFTNERIIFIGKQKNVTKHIEYNNILLCNIYQDGIMVNIPNRKPILFKFQHTVDFEIFELSDPINQFILISNRMMNRNFDKDIAKGECINSDLTKTIEEALVAKNYSNDLVKILSSAKVGKNYMTSEIQRKLNIGYARAGRYTDQLEALLFITAFENGHREWLVDFDDTDTLLQLIDTANPYPLPTE